MQAIIVCGQETLDARIRHGPSTIFISRLRRGSLLCGHEVFLMSSVSEIMRRVATMLPMAHSIDSVSRCLKSCCMEQPRSIGAPSLLRGGF